MNNLKFKNIDIKMILYDTFMMQSTKTTTMTIHLVLLTVLSPICLNDCGLPKKGEKHVLIVGS